MSSAHIYSGRYFIEDSGLSSLSHIWVLANKIVVLFLHVKVFGPSGFLS